MENSGALCLQARGGLCFEKRKTKIQGSLLLQSWPERKGVGFATSRELWLNTAACRSKAATPIKYSCSYKDPAVPCELKANNFRSPDAEALILKDRAQEVIPYLKGNCIFLVGMMGSGKTTVGKILSEALGYYFFDSDKLVEEAVGGVSVAQIFKEYSEGFFRESESNVLKDLSTMHRLVVATGGGAVIRPINWRYMKLGVTVWLDVPLEALAWRIAAVGTHSRPLLHHESGDAYTKVQLSEVDMERHIEKAFLRLSALSEERADAYANSDATVSLEDIAHKQGLEDVSALTPTTIAIETLVKINEFLSWKRGNGHVF